MRTQPLFKKQRGVTLFIALIALVILLLAAVSLIRSTDTALLISGNLAIKRDLVNEAENAVQLALTSFASGGMKNEPSRWGSLSSANYSASVLPSNAQGIPNILLDTDANYLAAYSGALPTANNGITYRYVIDRLCPAAGAPNTQRCVTGITLPTGGNARNPTENGGGPPPTIPGKAVYRVTVRVTDLRQTQSFIQTTFKGFGS
ncbi:hypothetical protein ELE36_11290 [Pseudolysobacter antarcticus]|uniref:Pilus assembly protein PilX n=1 Tax=Pseudolysobacter antarcticus TaxID=2511995 RepID=A0A411HKH4_9GAMM|nr:hypothetical protein [Pseudolysobacter antarcticus]QBB70887.1 hypothetical protein ELE36_11290 [Pseudolysobacter antarcticus]